MFPPRERNSNSIMRTSLNDPLHTVIHSRSEHIESRSDIAVVDDSWIISFGLGIEPKWITPLDRSERGGGEEFLDGGDVGEVDGLDV